MDIKETIVRFKQELLDDDDSFSELEDNEDNHHNNEQNYKSIAK